METKKRGRTENLKPWKPGQSGNPGGRPRTRALSEAYRAKLAEPVPGDPDGRTYAEVIADVLALAALKGNVRAAQELADRSEGRPKQQLEVEAEVGGNWAAVLEAAERRLDEYRARTIEGEVVERTQLAAAGLSSSLLPEEAGEPDTWQETRAAQRIPEAAHLPALPAPAPPEKQGEGERERQEPSQDEQPARAHDGSAGGEPGYVDWVSRLGSPGSTRPSGRRSGPHGWMMG